jgi:pimeloyl-ACP methyl ester carboxylesterase
MRIRALGGLEFEGSSITRPKPLLLLTYLSVEGPKARRDVADLFWPRSDGRLRTLTVTLGRLRSGALGCIASDGRKVWAEVDSDVAQLATALDRNDLDAALALYRGPFVEGFRATADAVELEEWVLGTREWFAATLQRRMLARAAEDVLAGRLDEARRAAERAVRLAAAPPPPTSELVEVHDILLAVGSADAASVAAEAASLGIELAASRVEAVERLRAATGAVRVVGVRVAGDADRPAPMVQPVRYVRSVDGARIAYATIGEGPPLVKAATWLSRLDNDVASPVWRHWLRALGRGRRLVLYDERGCGLSDRDVPLSLDAFVSDLEAIVDELELERFDLFGMSLGAAVAIAFAARHPTRVRRLVLFGPYIEPEPEDEARLLVDLIRTGWGRDNPAFRQLFTSLFMPGATLEQMAWFNELQRLAASADQAAALAAAIFRIDARPYLPHLRIPTLVAHARHDAVVPFDAARRLVARIESARLVALDSPNHVLLEHDSAWPRFLEEVRRFLRVDGEPVGASILETSGNGGPLPTDGGRRRGAACGRRLGAGHE